MRSFYLLSALFMACTAQAVIINALGLRTPNPPKYFSGTNCRAWGFVQLSGEEDPATGDSTWVYQTRLYIGGTLVASHYGDPEADGTAGEGVIFDSTHFPNGTNLEVKFECTCSAGHVHSSTRSVVVKNRAVGHDPALAGPACMIVQNCLPALNYGTFVRDQQFTASEYLADLDGATINFVGAHGCAAMNGFSSPAFIAGSGERVAAWNDGPHPGVLEQRQSQMGSGPFPYNSTATPPISLVVHQVCSTGWDNSFSTYLFPWYDAYNDPWATNQAFLGFAGYFNGNISFEFGSTLVMWMSQGRSVWDARDRMIGSANSDPFSPFRQTVQRANVWEPMSEDNTRIWGDYATRIKQVYLPNCFQVSTGWYR